MKQVLEAKGTDDEFAAAADLEMQPLMTETGIHIASTLFYATHRLGGDRTLERLGGPRVQWTDHIDGSTPKDRDETIDGAIQAMTSPP
ncbi:MAG: hypothetical protein EOO74_00230 [Myxococcales bacterium]|nr:MAG: hypothetical protein EOO74_00230 [Myxococcales bacterium]